MKFTGKGLPLSDAGMDAICDTLSVSDAEIWAVLTVETRGFGFLTDRRPQILFERHIFHRQTNGNHDTGNRDISNPNAGGYIGGVKEYKRLEKAMTLDKNAALKSVSWGIGQVMGFNHKVAGYNTVLAMVKAMIKDEDTQLMAVAKFIKQNNLAGAMQRGNWTSFARGYNGPAFKKNEYDTRLAAAHAKYKVILPDLGLRTAQAALKFMGFNPGPIDGLRGRKTSSALTLFQEKHRLPVTGDLDEMTLETLENEAWPA